MALDLIDHQVSHNASADTSFRSQITTDAEPFVAPQHLTECGS